MKRTSLRVLKSLLVLLLVATTVAGLSAAKAAGRDNAQALAGMH